MNLLVDSLMLKPLVGVRSKTAKTCAYLKVALNLNAVDGIKAAVKSVQAPALGKQQRLRRGTDWRVLP